MTDDAIMTVIKNRGGADAFKAWKEKYSEALSSSYTVSDVSVTKSFVGHIYSATIRVTHKVLFFTNTNVDRIEIIYGLDGEYRQVKSLVRISEFNPGLG